MGLRHTLQSAHACAQCSSIDRPQTEFEYTKQTGDTAELDAWITERAAFWGVTLRPPLFVGHLTEEGAEARGITIVRRLPVAPLPQTMRVETMTLASAVPENEDILAWGTPDDRGIARLVDGTV